MRARDALFCEDVGMERRGRGRVKRRRRSEGDAQKKRVLGSWTSEGGKGRAPQRSKQVNQRHAAQNGRHPILHFRDSTPPHRGPIARAAGGVYMQ